MRTRPWRVTGATSRTYRARVRFPMPARWTLTISATGDRVVSARSELTSPSNRKSAQREVLRQPNLTNSGGRGEEAMALSPCSERVSSRACMRSYVDEGMRTHRGARRSAGRRGSAPSQWACYRFFTKAPPTAAPSQRLPRLDCRVSPWASARDGPRRGNRRKRPSRVRERSAVHFKGRAPSGSTSPPCSAASARA
jgi:hypothetical protein